MSVLKRMNVSNQVDVSRQTTAESGRSKPRICMPSFRRFVRKAFQCGFYEAQERSGGNR